MYTTSKQHHPVSVSQPPKTYCVTTTRNLFCSDPTSMSRSVTCDDPSGLEGYLSDLGSLPSQGRLLVRSTTEPTHPRPKGKVTQTLLFRTWTLERGPMRGICWFRGRSDLLFPGGMKFLFTNGEWDGDCWPSQTVGFGVFKVLVSLSLEFGVESQELQSLSLELFTQKRETSRESRSMSYRYNTSRITVRVAAEKVCN